MFERLLIANRGEIARRIIRTARRLGITTIAVFTEADRDALHTAEADEAWCIGVSRAYLDIECLLSTASDAGADAIHPGYGFLSENADFAEACEKSGITFVGPTPAAIRSMGNKDQARQIAKEAGIPVVPGFDDEFEDDHALARHAEAIGFPVLIKAVAGGGGRGMRLVREPGEFASGLDGARREAQSAFGDARVFLERYIEQCRHIEIQVFADSLGNAVHLFERDCSVQRRHQKLVEEAPAPGMTEKTRAAMTRAALALVHAIGYQGAGTVEFIADASTGLQPELFWFIEMNTRLQVEHPVTEMITGLDLVEWQLRVAAGEPLPSGQEDLKIRGHAIEARICAEDPARDFVPSTGQIRQVSAPTQTDEIRIDSGVTDGSEVSSHYDSMIAKLIAAGEDRNKAITRLSAALHDYRISGVTTNVAYLARFLRLSGFRSGGVDTRFLASFHDELLDTGSVPRAVIAVAVLHGSGILNSPEDGDPWSNRDGWRLWGHAESQVTLECEGKHYSVPVSQTGNGRVSMILEGEPVACEVLHHGDDILRIQMNDRITTHRFIRFERSLQVFSDGNSHVLVLADETGSEEDQEHRRGDVRPPLPGRIAKCLVREGDDVRVNTLMFVLEAMKMEIEVRSPRSSKVSKVLVETGDQVEEDTILVEFQSDSNVH